MDPKVQGLDILIYRSQPGGSWATNGMAPRYLQVAIQPVAEVTSRRRLRSASASALVVPATRRSSLGDRAFAVAGPRAWNSLPSRDISRLKVLLI